MIEQYDYPVLTAAEPGGFLESSEVPDVACAAQQNIDDSAERLLEMLEVFQ